MTLDLESLKRAAEGATPGPWRWALNRKHKTCYLHGATNIVMDFWRWGMQRATPVFCKRDPSLLFKAEDFAANIPGREHHSEWHQTIDHPDAKWIELANPSTILQLIARLEASERDGARYRWLRDTSVPPHNFYLSVPIEFDGVRYTPQQVDAAIDAAIDAQIAVRKE